MDDESGQRRSKGKKGKGRTRERKERRKEKREGKEKLRSAKELDSSLVSLFDNFFALFQCKSYYKYEVEAKRALRAPAATPDAGAAGLALVEEIVRRSGIDPDLEPPPLKWQNRRTTGVSLSITNLTEARDTMGCLAVLSTQPHFAHALRCSVPLKPLLSAMTALSISCPQPNTTIRDRRAECQDLTLAVLANLSVFGGGMVAYLEAALPYVFTHLLRSIDKDQPASSSRVAGRHAARFLAFYSRHASHKQVRALANKPEFLSLCPVLLETVMREEGDEDLDTLTLRTLREVIVSMTFDVENFAIITRHDSGAGRGSLVQWLLGHVQAVAAAWRSALAENDINYDEDGITVAEDGVESKISDDDNADEDDGSNDEVECVDRKQDVGILVAVLTSFGPSAHFATHISANVGREGCGDCLASLEKASKSKALHDITSGVDRQFLRAATEWADRKNFGEEGDRGEVVDVENPFVFDWEQDGSATQTAMEEITESKKHRKGGYISFRASRKCHKPVISFWGRAPDPSTPVNVSLRVCDRRCSLTYLHPLPNRTSDLLLSRFDAAHWQLRMVSACVQSRRRLQFELVSPEEDSDDQKWEGADNRSRSRSRRHETLFWESEGLHHPQPPAREAQCVRTADVHTFLSHTVDMLGFGNGDCDDFVTYWLPVLSSCQQGVRVWLSYGTDEFLSEYNLDVNVDNWNVEVIRVFMIYTPLLLEDKVAVESGTSEGMWWKKEAGVLCTRGEGEVTCIREENRIVSACEKDQSSTLVAFEWGGSELPQFV